jgi:hypothetical protein
MRLRAPPQRGAAFPLQEARRGKEQRALLAALRRGEAPLAALQGATLGEVLRVAGVRGQEPTSQKSLTQGQPARLTQVRGGEEASQVGRGPKQEPLAALRRRERAWVQGPRRGELHVARAALRVEGRWVSGPRSREQRQIPLRQGEECQILNQADTLILVLLLLSLISL